MKTAIYIEDGIIQLVITPETPFEKDALRTLGNEKVNAKIFEGAFYDCRGGWVRQKPYYGYEGIEPEERSLIITANTQKG